MPALRSVRVLSCTAAVLLAACHGGDDVEPLADSGGSSSSSGEATVAATGSSSGSDGTTEGGTSDGGTSDGGTTTADDLGSSGPLDEGSTTSLGGSSSSDGGSSSVGDESSSDSTGETMPGDAPFPDAPAFGTNVLDLDLVGSWGLNWQPESGFDSVLEIADDGEFVWLETSADCSSSTAATGHLWVEGIQVVMHVDSWERPLPWDTEPVLGESFAPPFRLRMSFSLQGGSDAYLTLAAPARVTEAAPYLGSSYVRTEQQGSYLGGSWRGEAELQAVPAGTTEPVTIVRDVYEALLDPEAGVDDAESTGTRATSTIYYPVPQAFYGYQGGNWTCLGGCPAGSGLTIVDGNNMFTYGPYAGYQHLLSFVDGRTFRRGVTTDCE